MAKKKEKEAEMCCHHRNHHNSGGSAVYFFGFIGAVIYFIQQASNFSEGLVGFFKACVWPVYVVKALLGFLGL